MRKCVVLCVLLPLQGCDLSSLPTPRGEGSGEGDAANHPWIDAPAAQTPQAAKPGSVIVREQNVDRICRGIRVRCATDTERLVGGGCHGVTPMKGRPIGHGSSDTIGAGWECSYEMGSLRGPETGAYALCQVVH